MLNLKKKNEVLKALNWLGVEGPREGAVQWVGEGEHELSDFLSKEKTDSKTTQTEIFLVIKCSEKNLRKYKKILPVKEFLSSIIFPHEATIKFDRVDGQVRRYFPLEQIIRGG